MLQLTILHTNDMHGRLDAMARLATFVQRLRAEAEAEGRIVFFWDAGDATDRRVPIGSATKGAAFVPILNVMGYSLQTMGNDIALPYGPQALTAFAARANFPLLAANFSDGAGTLVEGVHDSVSIPLPGGLTLGVLGLTSSVDDSYTFFGMTLPDPEPLARAWLDRARAHKIAPRILLSHLGLAEDRRLAADVPGFDLIIGAHTHDTLPDGELIGDTLLAQAGHLAENVGRVDLTLDAQGRAVARTARVLPIPADEPPAAAVLAEIADAEREVARLMAEPIGTTLSALALDFYNECAVGSFAADAVRAHMQAEVTLLGSGQLHQGLPQGVITRGILSAACFSSANPGVTLLSGAQLRAALERGVSPEVSQRMHTSNRGTPLGIPQVSGIRVEHDPDAPAGSRIGRVWVNNTPLDPERRYRVAHTDAESSRDIGYFNGDGMDSRYDVPIILGEVMEEYLARNSPLAAPPPGRWRRV